MSSSHKGKIKHKEREAGFIPPMPAGTAVATPQAAGVLPKLAVPPAAPTAAALNGSNSGREREREREKDREQQQQQQRTSTDGSSSSGGNLSTLDRDLPPVKPPAAHDPLFPKLGPGRADSSSLPLPLSARERDRERDRDRDRDRALALEKEKERERKRNLSSGDASSIAAVAAASGGSAAAPPASSKISLPSVSPRTHHESSAAASAASAARIASRVGSINDPVLDALLRREPSGGPTSARSDKDAAELTRARSEKKKKNSDSSSGGSGKRSKEHSSKPTTRARAASEASANSVAPILAGFGTAQRIDAHVPVITSSPRPSDSADEKEEEEYAYEDDDGFSSPSPEPTQTTELVSAAAAPASGVATPAAATVAAAVVPPISIPSALAASASSASSSPSAASPEVAATTRRKVGPSVQQAHQLTARSTQDDRDYEPVSEDIEGASGNPSAAASAAPTPKHAAAATTGTAKPAVTIPAADATAASSPQTSPRTRRNGAAAKKHAAASPSPASVAKASGGPGSAKANKKKPAAATPTTATTSASAAGAAAPAKSSAKSTAAASASVGKKKPTAGSGSPAASSTKSKQSAVAAIAAVATPSKDAVTTAPAAAADDDYGDNDWRSDTAKVLPEHKESPSTSSSQHQPNFRLRAGSEHVGAPSSHDSNSHSSSHSSSALPKQLLRFTLLPETISSFYFNSSSSHSSSTALPNSIDFSRSTTLEFLRAREGSEDAQTSSDLESLTLGPSDASAATAVQTAPTSATQWEHMFSTTLAAASSKAPSVFTMDADALQPASAAACTGSAAASTHPSAAVLIQLWDNFYSCDDADAGSPRNNALERTLLAEFATTLGAIHAGDGSVTEVSSAVRSSHAGTNGADIPSTVRAADNGSFERTVKKIVAEPPHPHPPHPVVLHSAIKAPRSSSEKYGDPKPHNRVRFFHKVEVFTIEPRMQLQLQATVQLPQSTTTTNSRPPSQPKQQQHQRGEEKSNHHHSPAAAAHSPSLRHKPHPPQHVSPSAAQLHSPALIDPESGLDLAALIQPEIHLVQPRSRRGSGSANGAVAAFSSPVGQSKKSAAHNSNNGGALKPKPPVAAADSPVIPPLFPLGAAAAGAAGLGGGSFVRLCLRGLDFPCSPPSKAAASGLSWRFEMLLLHQRFWARLYSSELSATAHWKTILLANPATSAGTRPAANKLVASVAESILDAPLLIRCSSSCSVAGSAPAVPVPMDAARSEAPESTAQVVTSLRSLLPGSSCSDSHAPHWPAPLTLLLSRPSAAVTPGLHATKDPVRVASEAPRLLVTFPPPSTPAATTAAGSGSNASSRRGSGNHINNSGNAIPARK